jgi:hypothetical protein
VQLSPLAPVAAPDGLCVAATLVIMPGAYETPMDRYPSIGDSPDRAETTMKRSIVTLMGILVLCQSWASAATLCYTTGPLDNRVDVAVSLSSVFVVHALNDSPSSDATIQVLAFSLNVGTKNTGDNIFDGSLSVGPRSSIIFVPDVSDTFRYEVQVAVTGSAPDRVHIGGFGKTGAASFPGGSVPAQRLVPSEWVKISCGLFGPEAPL